MDFGEFNEVDFMVFVEKFGLKDGILCNYCKWVYEELCFVFLYFCIREDLVLVIWQYFSLVKLYIQKEYFVVV